MRNKSQINETTHDDHILPVGVNSLSDYTPHKLNLLLTPSIPIDITTSRGLSSNRTSNSLTLPRRSSHKPNVPSRKRSFAHYLIPITRTRSASLQTSEDTYDERREQHRYQHHDQQQPSQKQQQHQSALAIAVPSQKQHYQSAVAIAVPPVPHRSLNQCDMRFLIIRHGERVDRYFGANWYMSAFDQNEQYRPYHRNFPSTLPNRTNRYFWAVDTPLTSTGLTAAEQLGRILQSKQFQPHYVYASPAMRCVLTTIQILKGFGLENKIPIRIEPGLLELGASRFGMSVFFQTADWQKYGINVDTSYQPIVTHVPAYEREDAYYLRAKHVIREIEKKHGNKASDLQNILIIGHATSPETLTWDLLGKQPNYNDLYRVSLNIAYLQTVITERQQENKFWSLKPIRWL